MVPLRRDYLIMNVNEYRKLFRDWDSLLAVHSAILQDLFYTARKWNSYSTIGNVFIKHVRFVVYYFHICLITIRQDLLLFMSDSRLITYSTWKVCLDLKPILISTNWQLFASTVYHCHLIRQILKKKTSLKLSDIYIEPIQRIPRYLLLIKVL